MKRERAFVREKLIRFHHCDPAGIVFYPQYFVLFHELMEDWFNEGLNWRYAEFVSKERLGLPMVRVETDFLSPSKIGETLDLSLAIRRIGGSSMTLDVEASCAGVVRARALLTVVLATLDGLRAVPITTPLRGKLERFLLIGEDG
jgi:4-hydroxybenzoyl-CoA thioesterase